MFSQAKIRARSSIRSMKHSKWHHHPCHSFSSVPQLRVRLLGSCGGSIPSPQKQQVKINSVIVPALGIEPSVSETTGLQPASTPCGLTGMNRGAAVPDDTLRPGIWWSAAPRKPPERIELPTPGSEDRCSSAELGGQEGAIGRRLIAPKIEKQSRTSR